MYHTLLCFQHTVKNSGGGHNCALMHFDHREASRLQASIVYGRATVEASFLKSSIFSVVLSLIVEELLLACKPVSHGEKIAASS